MPGLSRNQRIQWLPIAVTVVCTAALALLLFTGVRLAARLQSASAALQLASSLTAQPQFLRSELTLIQRGLETRTYVGNSLRALEASRSASNQAYARLDAAMRKGGLATRTDTAGLYARAFALWQPLDAGLARLAQTGRTDLYADSAGGSTLTAGGAALKRSVDELLAAQTHATTALESELGTLAAQLREAVVHDGQALRGLLLGGAGLATLLLATMLYFAWRAGRAAEAAAEAERQVGNLLGTVREGPESCDHSAIEPMLTSHRSTISSAMRTNSRPSSRSIPATASARDTATRQATAQRSPTASRTRSSVSSQNRARLRSDPPYSSSRRL